MALPKDKKERFKALFEAREGLAKKFNLPPNLVIANPDLFVLTGNVKDAGSLSFCNKINDKMREEILSIIKDI
ncbi:hypothetical protein AGMMS50267_17800 [Spirochaetia bacterium]|nr:hypothetical protein AGMMS50267_17800 [Spirochaetia bacterium]